MGALSPEVASPLVNGLNNIPRTGKGALRCRQPARPPTGQYQRSSTSTAQAPKSLGRNVSEIQKGSHGRSPSTIAHSSAAGSFDAIPDKFVSEPSTKSADTETGEVQHPAWCFICGLASESVVSRLTICADIPHCSALTSAPGDGHPLCAGRRQCDLYTGCAQRH